MYEQKHCIMYMVHWNQRQRYTLCIRAYKSLLHFIIFLQLKLGHHVLCWLNKPQEQQQSLQPLLPLLHAAVLPTQWPTLSLYNHWSCKLQVNSCKLMTKDDDQIKCDTLTKYNIWYLKLILHVCYCAVHALCTMCQRANELLRIKYVQPRFAVNSNRNKTQLGY